MYVNCQPIGEKPLDVVDSRIDLNGEIVVAKNAETSRTFPIDLQWMVMTCDPQSVERETCDELPVSDYNKKPFKIHNCNNYLTLNIFLVFYYFIAKGRTSGASMYNFMSIWTSWKTWYPRSTWNSWSHWRKRTAWKNWSTRRTRENWFSWNAW